MPGERYTRVPLRPTANFECRPSSGGRGEARKKKAREDEKKEKEAKDRLEAAEALALLKSGTRR
jgi:hypothetical protein